MAIFFFFGDSAMGEVLKLPLLATHYREHLQRNPAMGTIEFLSMHYWGKDIQDHDSSQDMRLPFKNLAHSQGTMLFCNHQSVLMFGGITESTSKSNFLYLDKPYHLLLSKQFRPPQ